MYTRANIETAYCLMHQKWRVYQYSTMAWQRDDIEYTIGQYVDTMPADLFDRMAGSRTDFLTCHSRFGSDLAEAVATLEQMLVPPADIDR